MLLNTYEQTGKLFNKNFIEDAGAGFTGYRGELVLVEGEVADASGRRKPPVSVLESVVMLASADKVVMVSGLLRDVSDVEHFVETYKADIDPASKPLLFVVNAAKEISTEIAGQAVDIIPLSQGLVWTELCDLLSLEKSDFKGQSGAEKIATVYDALKDYKTGFTPVAWDEAKLLVTEAKRETRGAL